MRSSRSGRNSAVEKVSGREFLLDAGKNLSWAYSTVNGIARRIGPGWLKDGKKTQGQQEEFFRFTNVITPTISKLRERAGNPGERHRDDIFKIFRRPHPREGYGGGTGVGLAISKAIVERHEGRIWCETE